MTPSCGDTAAATAALVAHDLPRSPGAPRLARDAVRLALLPLAQAEPDLEGDCLLVVSELVTNALLHGEGAIRLEVEVRAGAVLVAVCDEGPAAPVQRAAADSAEGGRGVALVAAVARRWGVAPVPGGKRVWACLARGTACAHPLATPA